MGDIIKTTVCLRDISDFTCMNNVYSSFFTAQPPALYCQVAALPKNAAVEISGCIETMSSAAKGLDRKPAPGFYHCSMFQ
jgi:enamine deaminase RidA (YjgF/YER057c/UK114 family)